MEMKEMFTKIPKKLKKKLDMHCVRKEIKLNQAVAEAITLYLKQDGQDTEKPY